MSPVTTSLVDEAEGESRLLMFVVVAVHGVLRFETGIHSPILIGTLGLQHDSDLS